MCFSARMSFFAVGLLVSIAIATYRKVTHRSQIMLASMPIIFAVQQLAEAVLWLLLPANAYPGLIALAKYTFLGTAFVVWPTYIPSSTLLIEKSIFRRGIMAISFVIGIGWSIASFWYLYHFGATAQIQSCHIYYAIETSSENYIVQSILYCIITVVPLLASSNFSIRLLGVGLGISCLISYVVWTQFFISIWCFLAALLSLGIYKIIADQQLN